MDNRNAYRVMESRSPNEDIINTRLESLEMESDRYKNWRFGVITLSIFVIFGVGLDVTISILRSSRESSTCHDAVKILKEADSVVIACDHPNHRGRLDDKRSGVLLTCTCR